MGRGVVNVERLRDVREGAPRALAVVRSKFTPVVGKEEGVQRGQVGYGVDGALQLRE